MKEIIIRQQHPVIEGVERKSITVDEENNCTVIVYGKKEEPKFKRGDILRVPESIKIYQTNSCNHGDGLFINFNKKQFLGVNARSYVVDAPLMPLVNCSRIQCELIPCKREDLKAGDTAFASYVDDYFDLSNYCKILGSEYVAYISPGEDAKVSGWINVELIWYKVVPIKE